MRLRCAPGARIWRRFALPLAQGVWKPQRPLDRTRAWRPFAKRANRDLPRAALAEAAGAISEWMTSRGTGCRL
jgi:hypothetical protein